MIQKIDYTHSSLVIENLKTFWKHTQQVAEAVREIWLPEFPHRFAEHEKEILD